MPRAAVGGFMGFLVLPWMPLVACGFRRVSLRSILEKHIAVL